MSTRISTRATLLTQRNEIERLVSLGATSVDWHMYPPDPDFVVLADSEGNRSRVIDTSHG